MQFKFSNCGVSGSTGPNASTAELFYSGTAVSVQIVGEGIQKWTVPSTGTYAITAAGAAGCNSCSRYTNGKGAVYKSKFYLNKNDILYILVGQKGTFPDNGAWGGPGGGGTFVAKSVPVSEYNLTVDSAYVIPLLVAAGGGGTGDCNGGGSIKDGSNGLCETAASAAGTKGANSDGMGGAGFNVSNGNIKSFLNGGTSVCTSGSSGYGCGGFGCGGRPYDSAGGGGGFKGGDTNSLSEGGMGGYSYNSGVKVSCKSGKNDGHGYATIEFLRNQNDIGCACKIRSNSIWFISLIIICIIS